MRLVEAHRVDLDKLREFKEEFTINNEVIYGGAGLTKSDDLFEWLKEQEKGIVAVGSVPSSVYFYVDSFDTVIGVIDIRHELNEYLLNYGGHLGYSIRKSKRGCNHGRQMVLEAIKLLSVKEILIVCDDTNVASYRLLESLNGYLEDKRYDGTDFIRRYWVNRDDLV